MRDLQNRQCKWPRGKEEPLWSTRPKVHKIDIKYLSTQANCFIWPSLDFIFTTSKAPDRRAKKVGFLVITRAPLHRAQLPLTLILTLDMTSFWESSWQTSSWQTSSQEMSIQEMWSQKTSSQETSYDSRDTEEHHIQITAKLDHK